MSSKPRDNDDEVINLNLRSLRNLQIQPDCSKYLKDKKIEAVLKYMSDGSASGEDLNIASEIIKDHWGSVVHAIPKLSRYNLCVKSQFELLKRAFGSEKAMSADFLIREYGEFERSGCIQSLVSIIMAIAEKGYSLGLEKNAWINDLARPTRVELLEKVCDEERFNISYYLERTSQNQMNISLSKCIFYIASNIEGLLQEIEPDSSFFLYLVDVSLFYKKSRKKNGVFAEDPKDFKSTIERLPNDKKEMLSVLVELSL